MGDLGNKQKGCHWQTLMVVWLQNLCESDPIRAGELVEGGGEEDGSGQDAE